MFSGILTQVVFPCKCKFDVSDLLLKKISYRVYCLYCCICQQTISNISNFDFTKQIPCTIHKIVLLHLSMTLVNLCVYVDPECKYVSPSLACLHTTNTTTFSFLQF